MSKTVVVKKAVAVLDDANYKSIKDLGYNVAKRSDAAKIDGKFAVEHIAGFPETCPPEVKAEFIEGARLRANELPNYQPVEYVVIDGNYIAASQVPEGKKSNERYIISVASAFSYSQQQFGAMKNDTPQLYAIVQEFRKKVSKYTSGAFSDLESAARRYKADLNPSSKTRAATLAFIDRLEKVFADVEVQCKNAVSRGNDDTANLEKYKQARAAFYAVYNK